MTNPTKRDDVNIFWRNMEFTEHDNYNDSEFSEEVTVFNFDLLEMEIFLEVPVLCQKRDISLVISSNFEA